MLKTAAIQPYEQNGNDGPKDFQKKRHNSNECKQTQSLNPIVPDFVPGKGGRIAEDLFKKKGLQCALMVRTTSQQQKECQKEKLKHHESVVSHFRLRRQSIPTDMKISLGAHFKLIILPSNNIFIAWQTLTLVIVFYEIVMIPYSISFQTKTRKIDDMFDIIFGIDLLLHFFVAVPHPKSPNQYLYDRCTIAKLYLKGWFIFDLIACIPFDRILIALQGSDSSFHAVGFLKILRLPRLLRLVRLLRVLRFLRITPELRRWLQYSRHANLLRLCRLVLSFLVLTHILACAWYGGVVSTDFYTEDSNNHIGHYIKSFYICLLLVMGEDILPKTDYEIAFACFGLITGAVLMAIVFGNVAVLISNFSANSSAVQTKMEYLFESMRRMKLPLGLQNRIHNYYSCMWEKHGTLNGDTTSFISELSQNLASEVLLFLRMDMLISAPFFHDCQVEVLRELVMSLDLLIYMPNDYIVVCDEVGSLMYFIQSGICEVTKCLKKDKKSTFLMLGKGNGEKLDGETIEILSQGDYFGEAALLENYKHKHNIRAQSFTEILILSRDDYNYIQAKYNEDMEVIRNRILSKNATNERINLAKENTFEEHKGQFNFKEERIFNSLDTIGSRLSQIENFLQMNIQ